MSFLFYSALYGRTTNPNEVINLTTGELLIGILGAGIGSGVMGIILACLKRKWSKEDKHNEKFDAIINALKVLMIDRVRYLSKKYVEIGQISFADKENLEEMHNVYTALGGNGHLDTAMAEVGKLKVVG